ncbi:hypothetical protein LTR64_002183 [Lithohypha guttulata]|uniref:uncharacterized protein n=1 Tax=Lithohypha guttulata TaxID=1690604 RepID=UPI00315DE6CD
MKDAERNRHELIDNLIQSIQNLDRERNEFVRALRAKEMLANTYQDRFEATQDQVDKLQRRIDCDMFVLVLIDGDDTLFTDEYVMDGLQGGERAARDLQQALLGYFGDKQYFRHDSKIVTRIYMNLTGLSKTYVDSKIISNVLSFQQFVKGFNRTHLLMQIVDAGDGKEGADSKVKAEFDLFRRNVHCKQICLAGSGDNSYAQILRPYALNAGKSETITLIEALPFARELRQLSDRFKIGKFDEIFRDSRIITRKVSFHEDVNRVRATSAHSSHTSEALSSPPMTTNDSHTTSQEEQKPSSKAKRILVNGHDQRLDEPIKNLDKDLAYKLKQLKLCNRFYLSKDCSYGDSCTHSHKRVLTPFELDNLRYVARSTACEYGLDCKNPDCYNGHRCQYATRCTNWSNGICWFSDDMHKVETYNPKAVVVEA